jgi:hypothetical protein
LFLSFDFPLDAENKKCYILFKKLHKITSIYSLRIASTKCVARSRI